MKFVAVMHTMDANGLPVSAAEGINCEFFSCLSPSRTLRGSFSKQEQRSTPTPSPLAKHVAEACVQYSISNRSPLHPKHNAIEGLRASDFLGARCTTSLAEDIYMDSG